MSVSWVSDAARRFPIGLLLLIVFVVAAGLVTSHPTRNTVSNRQHVNADDERESSRCTADLTAADADCRQFYACLSHQLACPSIVHSVTGQLCRRLRRHHQHMDTDIMHWAENTNRCVVQRLASHFADNDVISGANRHACSDADIRIRSAVQWCAQQDGDRDDTCRLVLLDGQQMALSLFGHRNWMWLVEMMSTCPRHYVNHFVKWAVVMTTK